MVQVVSEEPESDHNDVYNTFKIHAIKNVALKIFFPTTMQDIGISNYPEGAFLVNRIFLRVNLLAAKFHCWLRI